MEDKLCIFPPYYPQDVIILQQKTLKFLLKFINPPLQKDSHNYPP